MPRETWFQSHCSRPERSCQHGSVFWQAASVHDVLLRIHILPKLESDFKPLLCNSRSNYLGTMSHTRVKTRLGDKPLWHQMNDSRSRRLQEGKARINHLSQFWSKENVVWLLWPIQRPAEGCSKWRLRGPKEWKQLVNEVWPEQAFVNRSITTRRELC